MRITEMLRAEHEVILLALQVLEDAAAALQEGAAVEPQRLGILMEFLREYADACHHAKEEQHLFPALEARGLPREGGPIGCMLHDHEEGRDLVRTMVALLPEVGAEPGKARAFAGAASQYCGHLRDHINKENNVLFRMAASLLTPAEEEALGAACARLEEEVLGAGRHAALAVRIHALADTH
jgi:hemerythrin-like domain-containing protein